MSRRALVAVALFLAPFVCHGADLGTYLGGSIGRGVEIQAVGDVGEIPAIRVSSFSGIGIGRILAVEIAYHDFGTTTCCGPSYADFGFERSGNGFSASAMALWPISRLRLFAKAGALWWDIDWV